MHSYGFTRDIKAGVVPSSRMHLLRSLRVAIGLEATPFSRHYRLLQHLQSSSMRQAAPCSRRKQYAGVIMTADAASDASEASPAEPVGTEAAAAGHEGGATSQGGLLYEQQQQQQQLHGITGEGRQTSTSSSTSSSSTSNAVPATVLGSTPQPRQPRGRWPCPPRPPHAPLPAQRRAPRQRSDAGSSGTSSSGAGSGGTSSSGASSGSTGSSGASSGSTSSDGKFADTYPTNGSIQQGGVPANAPTTIPVSSNVDSQASRTTLGPTTMSTSLGSSSNRTTSTVWKRTRFMFGMINQSHFEKIKAGGITALDNYSAWGDDQLLQGWQEAQQQLPEAVQRLAAVSRSGPVKLVCFDLETCNNGHFVDILELASVTNDGQQFQQLISPLSVIPPKATAIHGLTWSDVQGKPPLAVVLLEWLHWLERQCASAPGGSSTLVLMGHNIIGFDAPVLRNWFHALGQDNMVLLEPPAPKHKSKRKQQEQQQQQQQQLLIWPAIDTLYVAQRKQGGLTNRAVFDPRNAEGEPSNTLQALRAYFNIPENRGHRALDDCLVNMEVFIRLGRLQFNDGTAGSLELAAKYLDFQQQQQQQQPQQRPQQQQQGPPTQQQQQQLQQQQQPAEQQSHVPLQDAGVNQQQPQVTEHQQQRQQQQQQQPAVGTVWTTDHAVDNPRTPGQELRDGLNHVKQQASHLLQLLQLQQLERIDLEILQPYSQAARQQLSELEDQLFVRLQQQVQQQQQREPTVQIHHDEQQQQQQPPQEWHPQNSIQQPVRLPAHASSHAASTAAISSYSSGSSSSSSVDFDGAGPKQDVSLPRRLELVGAPSSSPSSSTSSNGSNGGCCSSSSSTNDSDAGKGAADVGSASLVGSSEANSRDILGSSGSSLSPINPEEVEAAVARALESLSYQDLRFDPQELAQAWPPFGQTLDLKDKAFTEGQNKKLMAAGFSNYLQVLLHAPRIAVYAHSICVSNTSEDDVDDYFTKVDDEGRQLVDLRARCLRLFNPKPLSGRAAAMWGAIFEAPADPPSLGPVGLIVNFFVPAFSSGTALSMAKKAYDSAQAAVAAGRPVRVKGRVMPKEPPYTHHALPDLPCTWQNASSPPVEVDWSEATTEDQAEEAAAAAAACGPRGSEDNTYSSTSTTIDSSLDGDVEAAAAAAGAAVFSSDSSSSDDSSGGSSGGSSSSVTLLPVYRAIKELKSDDWVGNGRTAGIAKRVLNAVRGSALQNDLLPQELRERYGLPGFIESLEALHTPESAEAYAAACKRIAFQELVLVQVAQLTERYRLTSAFQGTAAGTTAAAVVAAATATATADSTQDELPLPSKPRSSSKAPTRRKPRQPRTTAAAAAAAEVAADSMTGGSSGSSSGSESESESSVAGLQQLGATAAYSVENHAVVAAAKEILPWQLTADQERVLSEVLEDMRGPKAMLRLLQGDVGCGKTVVALMACLAAAASGYQALLFAPTELLASQHYATLDALKDQLPLSYRPRIGLLTGSFSPRDKKEMKEAVAAGAMDILISTQAALWIKDWGKLALVVVDEQHKLGVKQRERLTQGLPVPVHMLLMSATPIPRTLALIQFGGLALSTIKQLPPGRKLVDTKVLLDDQHGREQVYESIRQEIATGGRAYIVCPLVNENDANEGVRAVAAEYERLSQSGVFGDGSLCGQLHGRMIGEEKAAALARFASGQTPVLIASTVVEVGVDVPEASIMLVEAAARFGLAQLHQLRGRVGRGSRPSRCFLMGPEFGAEGAEQAAERLRVLEHSHDGLAIAEADLKIRGPGDMWSGTKQSGKSSMLHPVTWRELEADPSLMEHARAAAAQLLLTLGSNPALKAALLAYNLLSLKEGQQTPVLRDGVSGM